MHNQHPNPEQINPDIVEVSRLAEMNEHIQMRFHGIAQAIHEKREERAIQTQERLEQKDRLYQGIGGAALGDIPHADLEQKPKTFMEQRADRKLDRKATKMALSANDEFLAQIRNDRDKRVGAVSSMEKKRQDVIIRNDTAQGRLTATEARLASLKNQAATTDWTTDTLEKSQKKSAKASGDLHDTVEKLADSKWRNMRKKRAVKRAEKSNVRAEQHKNKHATLSATTTERQTVRDHYQAVVNNEVMHGPERP